MGSIIIKNDNLPAMTMESMLEQANIIQKSGLMPKEINTPEKIVSVAVYGKSQGLSFEEATIGQQVYVFEAAGGKLCMMVRSEKKLEQMMRNVPGFHYDILKETDDEVEVDFFRLMNGYPMKTNIKVSTKDSEIVPLLGKTNWKFRKLMLWYTALRRLGNKWPDYKQAVEVPMQEMIVNEVNGNPMQVDTNTGEVINAEIIVEPVEVVLPIQEQEPEPEVVAEAETISEQEPRCVDCGGPISKAEIGFSKQHFKRAICRKCQVKASKE